VQTTHVQNSPLQSGHWQPSQAHVSHAAFAAVLVVAEQPLVFATAAVLAAAASQAQLPHVQTSHVQNRPLQSGHWQSAQPQQADLAAADVGPWLAKARL
jgi:hypothetical protein